MANAGRIAWAWNGVRIIELYPVGGVIDEWEEDLIERIKSHGLDWQSDGEVVTYQDILGRVDEKDTQDLRPVDAWGQPYEFLVIDGFLAIRSSGADRVFDTDKYHYGSFPWLSGGDFVRVGSRMIRWTVAPRQPDWFTDNWLNGGTP